MQLKQRLLSYFNVVVPYIRSGYLPVAVFFAVWMLLFDENNIWLQYKRWSHLRDLEHKKSYYAGQTALAEQQYNELNNNPQMQEKYAREQYRMKKENEDVYIIIRK